MARAGYCSACGNYVFVRPDGGCGNGHGPEYVSNPYEVPDAPSQTPRPAYQPAAPVPQPPAYQQPATYPAPAYQQPPAQPVYAQPAYAPAAPAPKKKRTGLVVAIVIIALLLLCCCGAVAAIGLGAVPNPLTLLASPEHQKVAAAGDFFKSVATADLAGLTRNIPVAAAAAANPAFWTEKVLTASDKSTFDGETWNGDVLTQKFTDADGTKRTVTYSAIDGDKVEAAMTESGGSSSDAAVFTMVKEGAAWKVLALGDASGSEFLRFTPEAIKQLEQENK
jgi:hypothetical protein